MRPSRITCSTDAPRSRQPAVTAADRLRLDDVPFAEQCGPADRNQLSVDRRLDAAAGVSTGSPRRCGTASPRSRAALTTARARGCSLSASTAAASASTSSSRQAVADDPGHDVMAGRERAGLVEQHGVDGAHALERKSILDQDSGARRETGGHRDGERDREPERVRTRDHQNGHGALDGVVDLAEQRSRPRT